MSSEILDLETRAYIDSEGEFRQARLRGFLEQIMGFFRRHEVHLLSFDEVIEKLRLHETSYLGLKDIPVKHIVGSTGRYQEFTRHFFPCSLDQRDRERWRSIYTLAVTGKGFPPIDVYQVDQAYFVKDGNHRVSVARELGWTAIQAYVTRVNSPISLGPETSLDDLIIKEECANFLAETALHKTRPQAKQTIDFAYAGGYQTLLRHIKFYQQLSMGQPTETVNQSTSLVEAAAAWYDTVYQPIVESFQQSDILRQFPHKTPSDLYIWLVQNQAELQQRHDLQQASLTAEVEAFLRGFETVSTQDAVISS